MSESPTSEDASLCDGCGHDEREHAGGNCLHGGLLDACDCYGFTSSTPAEGNPYRHDHNPLNADFHGGICSACEWEADRAADASTPTGCVNGCNAPFGIRCSVCNTDKRAAVPPSPTCTEPPQ